jgi:hypothetical protein
VYGALLSRLKSHTDVNEAARIDARADLAGELDWLRFRREERHLGAAFKGCGSLKVSVATQKLKSRG